MKKILGLDIGTNSIGWSLIERDEEKETGKIVGIGSRIIPTDVELLSNYETGLAASKNAGRRQARGARRLKQRYKIRRERLIDTLKFLDWITADYKPGSKITIAEATLKEMRSAFGTDQISDDWVVYYLRHKALKQQIEKKELAMVLYHMNQRRGFKSNRKAGNEIPKEDGDEGEGKKKREKRVEIVTVEKIEDSGEKYKNSTVFTVWLNDGRKGTITRQTKPEWEKQSIELEITTIPPTRKDGERLEFRKLSNSDADKWAKVKVAREEAILKSGFQFPGNYYYHELIKDRNYIIKDVTVDRKHYVEELTAILDKQSTFYPELKQHVATVLAEKLYQKNKEKQSELGSTTLMDLFLNDIIYYQRPLKSKKSSIADCRYERKKYKGKDGKFQSYKAAPVSSPLFQEFRIWQTVNNLRILKRELRNNAGKLVLDADVSGEFLTPENIERLFALFDSKESVSQKQILKEFGLSEKDYLVNLYRMNEEKDLPANETKAFIRKIFKRAKWEEQGEALLADKDKLFLLWHMLYSLEEEDHIVSALLNEKNKFNIPVEVAQVISKAPAFKLRYGSLSHKAIKKLLPLMRIGKYWSWESIDVNTQSRMQKIFDAEFDEGISVHVRELFEKHAIISPEKCQGLLVPMAAYAVYGIHSERNQAYYDKPEQVVPIEPLNLRNPIVEQVVNETLRLVRDVWQKHGRPYEIHIELARDLKRNAKEREDMSKRNFENENENKRIAAILRELKLGNPNSLGDIEKLKIWEKQGDENARVEWNNVKFKKSSEPTKDEIEKYKHWTSQKFLCPYSGEPITLTSLFSKECEIDHIIPRSRFFDDSFQNKVVVKSYLNKDKGNKTAYEYLKGASSKAHKRFSIEAFEVHVNKYFSGKKKKLLLSEEVPDGFTNRHLNDSRYISKKLNELLAPVAENQKDPVISTGGSITSELKSAWGVGEKMKELVKWRFERLQEKTGEKFWWYEEQTNQEGKPTGKTFLKLKGYEKRIDHRHHALDALIIACTTRSHIKYLNDLNAVHYRKSGENGSKREEFRQLLEQQEGDWLASRKFKKPWNSFVNDAVAGMEGIIVSFKKSMKLSGNKANRNTRYVLQDNGSWKKQLVIDKEKLSPYVRQSLHKATIAGNIQLRGYKSVSLNEALEKPDTVANKAQKHLLKEVLLKYNGDTSKAAKHFKDNPIKDKDGNPTKKITVIQFQEYYVNRVTLDESFDETKISKIPDVPLQNILRKHLKANSNDPKEAFGSEGLERLNKGLKYPVTKVRIKEKSDSKFEIRPGAFTEADKGTNLFFVIYENLQNKNDREYASIPLRDVIEARKADSRFVEEKPGYRWFLLNPNDLVYLPDEGENVSIIDWNDTKKLAGKVYKMVSCNKGQAFFIPQTISKVIVDKVEYDSVNKVERASDGRMIKQNCFKLQVDRLGNIKPAK